MFEHITCYKILTPLDWTVFTATILITIAAVLYGDISAKQRNNNPNNSTVEYLLMGRQLTLPLFIATLTSTWYGGILGVTQIAFEHGIYNFISQGLFWYISYLLFAFCLVKKIRSYQVISLPALINKIFGARSALLTTILIIIKTLPITYAISIGILIQLFTNVSLPIAICIGVGFVAAYSLFGGLRAVVYSDFVQWLLMLIGVVCVVVFSVTTFGGSTYLSANLPASHFSFTGNHSLSTTLVWLFIAFSTTFISPAFYQRCFAAKSDKTAIYGIVGSVCCWLLIDLCTTLGGMYAKAAIPNADPTNAYLVYSFQLLPNGWKGLFLASLVATILSTLDSFLLLAAGTISYDVPRFIKLPMKLNQFINSMHTQSGIVQLLCNRSFLRVLSMICTAIITILFAILFTGKIETAWLIVKGYFSACVLFPLIIAYFFPNIITDQQFVNCCLASSLGFGCWKLIIPMLNQRFNINLELDPFYIGSLMTGIIVIGYIISYNIRFNIRFTKKTSRIDKPSRLLN